MSKPLGAAITTAENWIVMPTRNCQRLTRDAIASCLAQDIGDVRILACDDGSGDGVRQWLQTLAPTVQTICWPDAGVSRLWNMALSHIFDRRGAAYALVVNSDVRLRPDAYRRLVSDGGLFVTCVGTSSGASFPGGEPDPEAKRPHPDFSCFLIRRECWERVGPFDEDMRIYASDQDMHLRIHKAGIWAGCLDLPFYHYASGTLKQADEADRDRIMRIAEQDREAFEQKWGFRGGSDEYYKAFGHGAPE